MVFGIVVWFGGLDVLVNNAGIIETSLTDQCAVDTLPEEVWDAVYEVNLRAVWLATKFAAPHLRRSTRGPSIVNAASVSGLTGFPLGPIYCTSRGGDDRARSPPRPLSAGRGAGVGLPRRRR